MTDFGSVQLKPLATDSHLVGLPRLTACVVVEPYCTTLVLTRFRSSLARLPAGWWLVICLVLGDSKLSFRIHGRDGDWTYGAYRISCVWDERDRFARGESIFRGCCSSKPAGTDALARSERVISLAVVVVGFSSSRLAQLVLVVPIRAVWQDQLESGESARREHVAAAPGPGRMIVQAVYDWEERPAVRMRRDCRARFDAVRGSCRRDVIGRRLLGLLLPPASYVVLLLCSHFASRLSGRLPLRVCVRPSRVLTR